MSGRPRDSYAACGAATRQAVARAVAAEANRAQLAVLAAVISLTASYSKLVDRAGHEQIAEIAGVHPKTAASALRALRACRSIVYLPGVGRGNVSLVGLRKSRLERGASRDSPYRREEGPARSRKREPIRPEKGVSRDSTPEKDREEKLPPTETTSLPTVETSSPTAGDGSLSRPPRPADPVRTALAGVFGEPTTRSEHSNRGRVVAEIRRALGVGSKVPLADPAFAEVGRAITVRVRALRAHWRGEAEVTENALVAHWTLATRLAEGTNGRTPFESMEQFVRNSGWQLTPKSLRDECESRGLREGETALLCDLAATLRERAASLDEGKSA